MDPKQVADASSALFNGICAALADQRGVHLETALTAAGLVTGSAILRNCGIDLSKLPPGSPVFVDKVDEIGPMVLNTIFDLVHRGGVDPNTPLANPIPPAHQSLKSFDELLPLAWPAMEQICTANGITEEMRPFLGARACAQFILAGQGQVQPAILKAIVADAVVRGAKTVPVMT